MNKPVPRTGVMDIPYYAAGRSTVETNKRIYKLSSNESAIGPSPKAIEAYKSAASDLAWYPDSNSSSLREELAECHDLNPEQIICGAGSEDLLLLLASAYINPGNTAVHSEYGFPLYRIATMIAGGKPISAPERNYTADVESLLKSIMPDTRLLYLANPNNPTGTMLSHSEISRLHAALPEHVLLVLDSAYAEYIPDNPEYKSGINLIKNGAENVVVTRTFSKAYGLAAQRIGWLYCPVSVVEVMHRVRRTFGVTMPAQVSAIEALRDKGHLQKAVNHNDIWRPWLEEQIRDLGFEVIPGVANFTLMRFTGSNDLAKLADEFLTREGIITRNGGPYGLADCIRVTVGTEEANRAFITALGNFKISESRIREV